MSDSPVNQNTAPYRRRGKAIAQILAATTCAFAVSWVLTSWLQSWLSVASPPKLLALPLELDLGEAPPGQSLTGTILLKNVGGRVLHIEHVSAGCVCSSLELEAKSLSAGQEARLSVTAGIRKEGQHLVFPVHVSSDDADNPETSVLIRAGAAPPPIRTEPPCLDFGEVVRGTSSTQRLKLFAQDGKPWSITIPVVVKSRAGLVVAEQVRHAGDAPNSKMLLDVHLKLDWDHAFGDFEDMLSIRPADDDRDVEVAVRGKVVPLYVMTPTTLFLGTRYWTKEEV